MRKSHCARNSAEARLWRAAGLMLAMAWIVTRAADAAELTLTIEPRWQSAALTGGTSHVTNGAGQSLRLTRVAGLISSVALWRADGGVVRLDGQYGFIELVAGRRQVVLRGVPEGDFVGLEFRVGVPENVNHADPGNWPGGHPLNPLVNGLHWSWQGGYVFLALEGRWRTRSSATADERGFSYHLAREPQLMTVRFMANYTVRANTEVLLGLDLGRVLASQRLNPDDGSGSTHSAEGDALASQLARAVEHAWFWLDARPVNSNPAPTDGRETPAAVASGATPYAFSVPAGFPQPALPVDNPLTVEGVALGDALFFDPRLSRGGTQSCASCHAPAHAFSDTVAFSRGVDGTPGRRNAMPLFNLAWSQHYAWDGTQPRIRDQARAAWTSEIEMHADPAAVVAALGADPMLRRRFAAAFGDDRITADRIILALEQFLLVQVSAESKFDRSLRSEVVLTEEERRGFELFVTEYDPARGRRGADCFHCHGGALFTDYALRNNGLAASDETAAAKFKTPSLRNAALTAPYMHDGRFATLEQVVAHYDHGVARNAALDPNLAKHPAAGLHLSAEDQRALVAFLRTLTDERLVTPAVGGSGGAGASSPRTD